MKKKKEIGRQEKHCLIRGEYMQGPVAREIMDIRLQFSQCGQKSPGKIFKVFS